MERNEILALVHSLYRNVSNDKIVFLNLDQLENLLPNSSVCDLVFQDMRNLTPEQVVDEAMAREAEYVRKAGQD